MRQSLLYVTKDRRLKVEKRPKRVWTLFEDAPTLPFVPVHNKNAFIEDYIHDWTMIDETTMKYYSRVVLDSVWILVEYED